MQSLKTSHTQTSQPICIQSNGLFAYSICTLEGELVGRGVGYDQLETGENLPAGEYIVELRSEAGYETIKVVKR